MKNFSERLENQKLLIAKLDDYKVSYTTNMRNIELCLKRNCYGISNGMNQIACFTTPDVPIFEVENCEVKNLGNRIGYYF